MPGRSDGRSNPWAILVLGLQALLLGGTQLPLVAETIFTAEISGGGGSAHYYTDAFFLFQIVEPVHQVDAMASLFGATPISEADLGRVFVSTSSTDPDFDSMVALLQNGTDDWLERGTCLGNLSVQTAGCGSTVGHESYFFGRSPDFQGEDIQSISFRVEEISIDPGTWSAYSLRVTLMISSAEPSIALAKTGVLDLGADGVATPGDVITYTLQVSNDGNVTLSNVLVSDPLAAPVTCPSGNPIPTLVPGASESCTVSYAITQTDISAGEVLNTAEASGADPMMQAVADTDSDTVTVPPAPVSTTPTLGLAILALLLAGAGTLALRRRGGFR